MSLPVDKQCKRIRVYRFRNKQFSNHFTTLSPNLTYIGWYIVVSCLRRRINAINTTCAYNVMVVRSRHLLAFNAASSAMLNKRHSSDHLCTHQKHLLHPHEVEHHSQQEEQQQNFTPNSTYPSGSSLRVQICTCIPAGNGVPDVGDQSSHNTKSGNPRQYEKHRDNEDASPDVQDGKVRPHRFTRAFNTLDKFH